MLIDLKTAEKVPFDVDGKIMFTSEKVQIIHINLQPGEEIELHSNPFDVVFYILEGEGNFRVGDNKMIATKDQSIHIKANIMRGSKNTSDKLLRFLVVKILK